MFDNLFSGLLRAIAPPAPPHADGTTTSRQVMTTDDARQVIHDAGFSETIQAQALARLERHLANGADPMAALEPVMAWATERDEDEA